MTMIETARRLGLTPSQTHAMASVDRAAPERPVGHLLVALGGGLRDEGLRETPRRTAEA